ncbi:unnamed protein product [Kuraishia capsulata CBS 1993]|uniref:Amidase domain-containing protein n=1 Tax=Kuraishia capsulata CBS 1993 TaxID=1382522 RepID=W6MPQ5_9ASCO|nr:uncharacterized protein KUCA_T00003119001 [Kuraishia capsulata CBS 1993]CDK27142.1 unnamed protein product [Kuraishia capsulata CBS 1993]
MTIEKDWKKTATEKKQSVDACIPKEWRLPLEVTKGISSDNATSVLDIPRQFLSEKEISITEDYSARSLHTSIVAGKLTAVDVISAFSHRAAIATQLTNCCTEILFDYGLERAKFLDEYLSQNKRPYGPLHGVPVSLKDCYNIEGYDSTVGFVSLIGKKATSNSSIVEMLLDLGAVFYVKTNIPQGMMTADSDNNIFGRTLNPLNLTLTAGGSSGGEGSLIKLRGSILGVGSDGAGSIRIPAMCNGIYGYRPTSNRLPARGQAECTRDVYIDIPVVAGPMATNIEDILLFTESVINKKPWRYDPSCVRFPWQNIEDLTKLRIGFILEDPELPIHPPMKRILQEAVEKLEANGHYVEILKTFPSYVEGWTEALLNFAIDPQMAIFDHLEKAGEPPANALCQTEVGVEAPREIDDIIKLKKRCRDIEDRWFSIFNEHNFDVIISPGAAGTAPPHDTYGMAAYTCMWNLVDFPATVIPFGKVDSESDVNDDTPFPEKLKGSYPEYDRQLYSGGIGHVQIVGPRFEDERLLACTEIIDQVLNN